MQIHVTTNKKIQDNLYDNYGNITTSNIEDIILTLNNQLNKVMNVLIEAIYNIFSSNNYIGEIINLDNLIKAIVNLKKNFNDNDSFKAITTNLQDIRRSLNMYTIVIKQNYDYKEESDSDKEDLEYELDNLTDYQKSLKYLYRFFKIITNVNYIGLVNEKKHMKRYDKFTSG